MKIYKQEYHEYYRLVFYYVGLRHTIFLNLDTDILAELQSRGFNVDELEYVDLENLLY